MADTGLAPNHSLAMLLQALTPEEGKLEQLAKQGLDAAGEAALRDRTRRHLEAFLSRTTQDIIISGEGLTSGRMTAPRIARLLDWLAPFFDRFRAVAYVRPPADLVVSMFQQRVRNRLDRFTLPVVAYRDKLEPWVQLLGADQVVLRPYLRDHLVGGDVVRDFAHLLGLDGARLRALPPQNTGLPAGAVALLYLWNRQGRVFLPGPDAPRRKRKFIARLAQVGGPSFGFARPLLARHVAGRRADLDWLGQWIEAPMDQLPPEAACQVATQEDMDALALAQAPALQALAQTPAPARALEGLGRQMQRLAPHTVRLPPELVQAHGLGNEAVAAYLAQR
ncbi:hypothetical protein [Tateyamaria omphalii]|uniref:Uncharacterized protein n=1 Tax=Tateyamaria omphalii TaxID=299262 RepID=A0A1P8N231_9RHOB|nr:hypothetical protein [Tateyamaria omphalii]APX14362.1 hypothetical protein BWR18_21225 [Tateyamaria omphalii]